MVEVVLEVVIEVEIEIEVVLIKVVEVEIDVEVVDPESPILSYLGKHRKIICTGLVFLFILD